MILDFLELSDNELPAEMALCEHDENTREVAAL